MKTAELVKKHPDRSAKNNSAAEYGLAALYKLSEPLQGYDEGQESDYLYVSTSRICGTWETYAFLAKPDGDIISWTELPCSSKVERYRGTPLLVKCHQRLSSADRRRGEAYEALADVVDRLMTKRRASKRRESQHKGDVGQGGEGT